MFAFFLLLWLFCTVMLVIGLINPQKALIPYAKQGRKQVFVFWFLAGLISFILTGANAEKSENNIEEISKSLPTYEVTEEPIIRSAETATPLETIILTESIEAATPTITITTDAPTVLATKSEKIVYITNLGSKYHRYGCRSLNDSCIEITLTNAIAKGYEPCKICNP
ncbi:MAG: hypothetical protein AB1Z23_09265 [Eubacteriales bacterium]